MEQGRAGERARWTGKGKAGRCFLPLTWMVVDLNIMSCPSVPTLGIYSRMILHPNSYMLCTCHDEIGSCTHKVQLCLKQHTNSGLKKIVSSVLILRSPSGLSHDCPDFTQVCNFLQVVILTQVQLSSLAAVIPNMHQKLCARHAKTEDSMNICCHESPLWSACLGTGHSTTLDFGRMLYERSGDIKHQMLSQGASPSTPSGLLVLTAGDSMHCFIARGTVL